MLEDDKSICELVRCALEMADVDTVCFNTVADFNAALNQHLPAVALLDIMLPDGSGLDVLKKLKQSYPQVACIMLSALGQESDKVKGLNLGADDYISKPFGVLELTARVNVALRKQAVSDVLVCGNISLDEKSMSVSIDGRTVELNNKGVSTAQVSHAQRGQGVEPRRHSRRRVGLRRGEKRVPWTTTSRG